MAAPSDKAESPSIVLDRLAQAALDVVRKASKHRRNLAGDNFYGNKLAQLRAEPDIQKVCGSLGAKKAAKGVFLTTSYFTKPAVAFAEHHPYKIVLIDGELLARLMIRHSVGVRVVETMHYKTIDDEFFPRNESRSCLRKRFPATALIATASYGSDRRHARRGTLIPYHCRRLASADPLFS